MRAAPPPPSLWRRAAVAVVRWFDTAADDPLDAAEAARIDWLRVLPFIGLHLACLGVLWVGVSPFAVGVAVALYVVRMFAITGFYHRYFSHKAFRTSLLRRVEIESERFGVEIELTAKLARARARFYEVPISYHGRGYDEGKKITWKDGVEAFVCIGRFGLLRNLKARWGRLDLRA